MLDVTAVANALDSGTNVLPETRLETSASEDALVPGSASQEALAGGLQTDISDSLDMQPEFVEIGNISPGQGVRRRAETVNKTTIEAVLGFPRRGLQEDTLPV
jgi:hypothetical protein